MNHLLTLLLLTVFALPVQAQSKFILCTGMSNASDFCRHWKNNNTTGHFVFNGAIAGKTYTRFRLDPSEVEWYWAKIQEKMERNGYSLDQVEVIYNLNITTCGRSGEHTCEAGADTLRDEIAEGQADFQQEVAARFLPNQYRDEVPIYHGIRSTARLIAPEQDWATKSPLVIAHQHREAILQALVPGSYLGPDLSLPDYVREDYLADGTHPTTSGKVKATAVLNRFFMDLAPQVPEAHVSAQTPLCPLLESQILALQNDDNQPDGEYPVACTVILNKVNTP